MLTLFTMTVFIFFATPTWARIVPPNLRSNFHRRLFYCNVACDTTTRFETIAFISSIILAGTVNVFFVGAEFTEIGFFLPAFLELRVVLLYRNLCMTKEGDNVLVQRLAHLPEQAKGFHLVDHERIFLFEV